MSGFSDDMVRDIAGQASSIQERLDGHVSIEPATDESDREVAEDLLNRWRQAAVAGDERLFDRRLELDGLDRATAIHLLGRAQLDPDAALPQWAATFQRVVSNEVYPPPAVPRVKLITFEEILRPIVTAACRILIFRSGDVLSRLFGEHAIADIEHGLLVRLSELCAPGLFGDFNLYRHLARHQRGRFALPFSKPGDRIIYESWLDDWRDQRCRDFFVSHPVAARLIGLAVDQWIEATSELIQRLAFDLKEISGHFFAGTATGLVERIETNLSDPHREGRMVAILSFTSGLKLVYKPKDLKIDAAWADLVGWLNDRNGSVPIKPVRVLARDDYGWAEFIRADDFDTMQSGADSAAFYRQAGGLLALLHALRGADFHQANVIFSAGSSVAIDLETLLQPNPTGPNLMEALCPAEELAVDLLGESVLATLYLPTWSRGHGGRYVAIGGLDNTAAKGQLRTQFEHVNSDAMSIAASPVNDAVVGASPRNTLFAAHLPDFIGGFREYYQFLLEHRHDLVADDGPLAAFRNLDIRVLFKSTKAYFSVDRHALAYSNLGNGAAWSMHFDSLLRTDLAREVSADRWAIFCAERKALGRCDVPMFTLSTNATRPKEGSSVPLAFEIATAPYHQLLDRIRQLGPDDRLLQERLITSTVASSANRRSRQTVDKVETPDMTEMAIRLGDALDRTAIRSKGQASWFGIKPIDHDHHHVWALGIDLFSGTTGVALFLAALEYITKTMRFRELALAAIAPARARLKSGMRRHAARSLGLGAGTGLGSIIYSLVKMGQWLEEPRLIEDAHALTKLVDPDLIAADTSLDLLGGAAGAILGLLALHRANPDDMALATAAACGEHLLRHRTTDRDGNLGWSSKRGTRRHLTGISHGAAGIALALLRLHEATSDARFRSAAEEALGYERRLFMPRSQNWPDLRYRPVEDGTNTTCQWCHGGTGIGLARVGCLDLIEDEQFTHEIDAALSATLSATPRSMDQLCCGNLGRIDFLLTAGLRLSRPDLVSHAQQRTDALLRHAVANGQFAWDAGDDEMNPGFFQGTSGIGYQLLRLAEPEKLPSVLLWD